MFPSVFVSHGSPDLPMHSCAARDFLMQLGKHLGKPQAVLCISAHWLSRHPVVSAAKQPSTIYDFFGFPQQLYQMGYPAPGAPGLASRVTKLLNAAGFNCQEQGDRGLDHGAWEPLMLMYPDADIPVTQLSLQPNHGVTHHLLLGQALEPLRHEGVLVLCSGSTTHNLRAFGSYSFDAAPPQWVTEFDDWLAGAVIGGNVDDLLDYRRLAPHATRNHPSDEHLLPLFVAMGAGGLQAKGTQIHSSFTYGVLSMAAYAFS
jgi:4,5-DOPA dioxygenase extradiol